MATYGALRQNAGINTDITRADESLPALGFAGHSLPRACRASELAGEAQLRSVVDFFEIFMKRLGLRFLLAVNGRQLV